MKRYITAGVLIAVILLLYGWQQFYTVKTQEGLQDLLTKGIAACEDENVELAVDYARQAVGLFDRRKSFLMLYMDKDVIRDISEKLLMLEPLITQDNPSEYCSNSVAVMDTIRRIHRAEIPHWENIF